MRERKIYFIGGIFPPGYDVMKFSKGPIQYAADGLQKSILMGLAESKVDCEILNLPFVGSFPLRYKFARIGDSEFKFSYKDFEIKGYNIGFENLILYKLYSRYICLRQKLEWMLENEYSDGKDIVLMIYSIHTPFLKASVDVKKKFPDVKIVQIVPDLPEYMESNKSLLRNVLECLNDKILQRCYGFIDGYVLLSEYMSEKLPILDKPQIVVEGIYQKNEFVSSSQQNIEGKYILYTGTLSKRYGILNLVNAFALIKDIDCKLVICGDGDTKEEIIEASSKDNRIKYLGQVSQAASRSLQKKASLLVNPRTSEGDYTKYSFPSKTMEYLGTGIPTLIYRLPGIPDEYYEYCFSLSELGVIPLANKIKKIMEMNPEDLARIGQNARKFILREKTPMKQVGKILLMLDKI